jgi:O-antigen ligase
MNISNFIAARHWDLSRWVVLAALTSLGPLFVWEMTQDRWRDAAVYVLLAFVPVVVRWPIMSTFTLYALLVPFDSVSVISGSGGTTLTKVFGLLSVGGLFLAGFMGRRLVPPPRAAIWWGAFVSWAILGATWAIDPQLMFGRLSSMLSLFLLYLAATSVRPSRLEFYAVAALLTIGGAAAALVTYAYGPDDAAWSARGRLVMGDATSNPNQLGVALVMPLALAIAGCMSLRRGIHRMVSGAVVCLIVLGLYASGSRGAFVGALVALTVFVLRMGVRRQVVSLMVGLVIVTAIVPNTLFTRVEAIYTGEDATGSGRTEIWDVAATQIPRYGFVGAGLDSFPVVYMQRVHQYKGAHNTYLAMLIELGAVGLVFMLGAIGSHLLGARRARRATGRGVILAAVESGCFGILALMLFGDEIWTKAFWLSWILLTWASSFARNSDRAAEPVYPSPIQDITSLRNSVARWRVEVKS